MCPGCPFIYGERASPKSERDRAATPVNYGERDSPYIQSVTDIDLASPVAEAIV